jgi:hypothetical protein
VKKANVYGTSRKKTTRGDEERGTWCTPKWLAEAVGPFHLDPFSNPRSHIESAYACMLERQDDGLSGPMKGQYWTALHGSRFTDDQTRVFLQPPYSVVTRAFEHYHHTRWVALLRFDPSTKWFRAMYREAALICVPRKRVNFEPPPGVKASSNTIPHALYYRHAEDVTDAVLRACIAWRPR